MKTGEHLFFPNILKKKGNTAYETSPAAKTKLDLKNWQTHVSNHTRVDCPNTRVALSPIVLLRTNA
jgi:hypothetical protein